MAEILEKRVEIEQGGQRLDQVAAALFPEFSRARLQRWIKDGALTVDAAPGKPSQKIYGGEYLRLVAEPEREVTNLPQDIPLDVLFEDDEIIVVNKPAGLVVHPAAGHPDGTLQNGLLHFEPDLASVPRAGIVHRLDKDTSGVMVVARSLKAHASLVQQLQTREMGRVYRGLVQGEAQAAGSVDAPIGRHPRDRKKMAVVASGKAATSHFRLLKKFSGLSYLEVSLESGRTHQIRVHMRHIGLPMVGDPLYGQKMRKSVAATPEAYCAVSAFPRQALHALRLRLRHPSTGVLSVFEAPVANDIEALLRLLLEQESS